YRLARRSGFQSMSTNVSGALVTLLVAAFAFSANVCAHGGKTDKNGCHVEAKTKQRHCHAKAAKSVCNGKAPAQGDDNVMYGRVVSVTDGDTFKARIQGTVLEFRMSDIDAPEKDQPYGRESRTALAAALDGKEVVMLRVDNNTTYGRLVVHVWIGSLHVNRQIVADGAAWFYTEYAHDDCLYQFENEARDAKRGLWALPLEKRIEPWVWRHNKRDTPGDQRPGKVRAGGS
ncbi:MAG TPA: thermonuclease family protein, partial [Steroidobacteraceae bacterium]|nr:thermonuclease family protein [Steroidobacteraceae bacterium]